jgi:transposase
LGKPLVDDALWKQIESLLPPQQNRNRQYAGRKIVGHREALSGILFVVKSGIPWEILPQEMGCASGVTCWRRLKDWQETGVWQRLHEGLLAELRRRDQLDLAHAVVDSSSVRAMHRGKKLDRTQPIAVRRAASTTFSPTRKASRSRP